jgi:ABC-type transport system involved in cytochrome c biogenesis permease component
MAAFLSFVLGNFTLTLVLGLIASAISLWLRRGPLALSIVVEEVLAYFLL